MHPIGKLDKMDTTNGERHVFNLKLVKLLGLYHILRPSAFKMHVFNVHAKFLLVVFLAPMIIVTFTMCPIAIHYLMNDLVSFGFNVLLITNMILSCHKAIIVLHYSNKIWKCFEISSLHFLSYQNYNTIIFKCWQRRTFRDIHIVCGIHDFLLFMGFEPTNIQ